MDSPIFLFSAGWRSGSTLLQRMIISSGENLIMGESGGALNYISDSWQGYNQMLSDGSKKFKFGYGGNGFEQFDKFSKLDEKGVDQWIASMNVSPSVFLGAYKEFFERIYAKPAKQLGYDGWGVKEVQCGIETAEFLKIIYPKARFVFLVRHPLNCLLSIKRRNWLDENNKTEALIRYSRHWSKLSKEFKEAKFGLLIKYEDIINNIDVLDKLICYLDLKNLKKDFLKKSRADWSPSNEDKLTFFEKQKILKIVSNEMKLYGYK